jgi:hypothetical protein
MAMAAHNPAFAKKKGIPVRVANDFNRADKRSGILKKGGGGPASMMGHALSGTQLGGTENLIRKAQDRFTSFAAGGAVKKPAGPSAKERREVRSMIEQGKSDAVGALRGMRSALISSQEDTPVKQPDADQSLARLRSQLATKVPQTTPNPSLLHDEYRELMQRVDDPRIDPELRSQMGVRLADIEQMLGALS